MEGIREKSILKNKNFMLLWLGQLVSQVGSAMHSIAAMWYVLEVTGSTTKTGISLVFSVLPYVLLSPFTGVLVDRLDRKKIIVISDLINGLLVGIISILVFTNNMELWMLYTLSALMSATSAFFNPAISAVVPTIVEKDSLVKANSFSQMTRYGTSIFGPALGGILIAVIGIPGLFLLNSISFILSGISETFIDIPRVERNKEKNISILSDMKEGLYYTVKNKSLLHIIIVGGVIINFFFAPFSLFIAVLSRETLNLGSTGYGTLLGFMSAGGLLTSFIIPMISKKIGNFKLMFIGLTLEGLFLMLFSLSNNIFLAIVSLILMGSSFGIVNVSIGTVIPFLVPNNMMGRVSSIMGLLCQLTVPLGYYLGGVVLESFAVGHITFVSSIFIIIAGLSTITVVKEDSKETQLV